ncbi:C4-dicarboxylate transporter DctQ subunit [Bacillus thermophilus]|uniref:C4-dicarboxylate transporter DctQ subunit n=1 Tax=Siminovitchia thermophila TaxID=1245522 RepID=A0ABS2R0T6_9BACI|nr:TRAP transporter small permease [Siminovitchia thermophila]MBM7713232.1 C4-dicarboxylate transporter DctQ subunit [Siminovitchia thermophila]ONK25232.1 TRAP transporter small permease protein [Bacillus sp. VT-16-64]
MKTLSNWIEAFEKLASILLIAAMTVVLFISVIFRYFLNAPLFWANEASIFMMAWLTFIGGSLGLKYKSQASITFLVDRFSEKGRKILFIMTHIIILIALAFLLYLSYQWVFTLSPQKSSSMRLPMWLPYLSVPVGLTFAFIHLLDYFIDLCKNTPQSSEAS